MRFWHLQPPKGADRVSQFKGVTSSSESVQAVDRTRSVFNSIKSSPFTQQNYEKLSQIWRSFRSPFHGMQIHTEALKYGFTQNLLPCNHLVNIYSKCHCFEFSHKFFQEFTNAELFSWTTLISSYVQNGFPEEALSLFVEMHSVGIKFNIFIFPSVLKACSATSDPKQGMQVHGMIVVTGFESDVYIANTLVVMYAKCGYLLYSAKVFDKIPDRDIVSWNSILSSYVQNDLFYNALCIFQEMAVSGVNPDEFSISSALNACIGSEDLLQGRRIHAYLIRLGYDSDSFSSTSLTEMYGKLGDLEAAMMSFMSILYPDIISWNAFIASCVIHESHSWALILFEQMKFSDVLPNMFTWSSILKTCAELGMEGLGRQMNACVIKTGYNSDVYVNVGLVDMYSKCDIVADAWRVFDSLPQKSLICWNSMISGCSLTSNHEEAVHLFCKMHRDGLSFSSTTLTAILKSVSVLQAIHTCKQVHSLAVKWGLYSDVCVANSHIDAYGKCGSEDDAAQVFSECPAQDLVPITSMITAYSQNGQDEMILRLFCEMLRNVLRPDHFIFCSLLNSCACLSSYEQGKQIHVHLLKSRSDLDVSVGNALVNMYAKCGSLEDANRAFWVLPERGTVSWSAMIAGVAKNGYGIEALGLFKRMLKEGLTPNDITMVSILCACNHAGLVSEAKWYFKAMTELFGIEPTGEHYSCMIDVLGRAGKLSEAVKLVNAMPFKPDASVWGALLSASTLHRNLNVGQCAAKMLFTLEPWKSRTYVLLANLFASMNMWGNVAKMRRLMKNIKVKKEPGISWIELKESVHVFIAGDRSHPRLDEIHAKLEELSVLLSKAGYRPQVDVDLHDVPRSEKEFLLLHHSEKLALAFGLISLPTLAPVRIMKNLRVCNDCHAAFKFVSKSFSRLIILRDINRFHHFRDGSCSCNDYW